MSDLQTRALFSLLSFDGFQSLIEGDHFLFFFLLQIWLTVFRVLEGKADDSNYLFLAEFFSGDIYPYYSFGIVK